MGIAHQHPTPDVFLPAQEKELVLTGQGIAVQETVLGRLDRVEALVEQALSEEERRLWFSCIRKIEAKLEEAEYD